jgi:hypothetical protein
VAAGGPPSFGRSPHGGNGSHRHGTLPGQVHQPGTGAKQDKAMTCDSAEASSVPDGEAQHCAPAVGPDAGGDHDRPRHGPAAAPLSYWDE